jgi:hypothetical protein
MGVIAWGKPSPRATARFSSVLRFRYSTAALELLQGEKAPGALHVPACMHAYTHQLTSAHANVFLDAYLNFPPPSLLNPSLPHFVPPPLFLSLSFPPLSPSLSVSLPVRVCAREHTHRDSGKPRFSEEHVKDEFTPAGKPVGP